MWVRGRRGLGEAGLKADNCRSVSFTRPEMALSAGSGGGALEWGGDAVALPDQRMLEVDARVLEVDSPHAAKGSELPASNMLFLTWIAFGDFGDGGFRTHNFHSVDMR